MKTVSTVAALSILALMHFSASTWQARASGAENQTFVIRSSTGRCLDANLQEANSDGGRVQVWTCNAQPQQLWTVGFEFSLRNAAGNLCLSLLEIDSGNGGKVGVRKCTFGPTQHWNAHPLNPDIRQRVALFFDMCIDVHAPDRFVDGGRVQAWLCNGQPQQKWRLADPSEVAREVEIRTAAGLCLDAEARAVENNGAPVQVWACNSQAQQRWAFDPTTRAVRVASGLCLDVDLPAIATNGGRVQLWACNGQAQQQWTPSTDGSLRNAGGLCLDVHAPDQMKNGGRVQVWQCNGQPQQHFASSTLWPSSTTGFRPNVRAPVTPQ